MYDDILGKRHKVIVGENNNKDMDSQPFKSVWKDKQRQIDKIFEEPDDFEDEYDDLQMGSFMLSYKKISKESV